MVQTIHTFIDGEHVVFAVIWEGYLNQFTDPEENPIEKFQDGKKKFEENFTNKRYEKSILISDFVEYRVEARDYTLTGFRILIGVNPRERQFKDNYGKVASIVKGRQGDRVKNALYRFDKCKLNEKWKEHLGKVKHLVLEQAKVWNEIRKLYRESKGTDPSLFELISQTTFDAHPTIFEGKIRGVIISADPPFLREPHLGLVATKWILEDTAERLRSEGLDTEASKIENIKLELTKILNENYKLLHNSYTKFIEENDYLGREKRFTGVSKWREKSEAINFVALDEAKYNLHEFKVTAKEKIYGTILEGLIAKDNLRKVCWEYLSIPPAKNVLNEGDVWGHVMRAATLALIDDETFSWHFDENRKLPNEITQKIIEGKSKKINWEKYTCTKSRFNLILKKGKVSGTFKSLLQKTLSKPDLSKTSVLCIALFASTCFLGTRIGMEVYVKLPENFKGTLKAGKGKIKVYVILALISYALMNIDDYQDFSNLLTNKNNDGSLKDMVKVLLQTFLGSILNGMLLQMLIEGNNVILAAQAIPYIARTLFGNNAWIFEKIIWPTIDTSIQIFANGGPTTYLLGIAIGTITTQILQQII